MTRILLSTLSALLVASFALAAQPAPPEVSARFSSPELQGAATTRAWGLKLFDAELWMEDAGSFSFGDRFALSLTYGTRFSKESIAKSTVSEIVRVEGGSEASHQPLYDQLVACIPDVYRGLRITGMAESASRVSLYVKGRKACTLSYPNLRKRFFGIWLAPSSRDARAAARLTGRS